MGTIERMVVLANSRKMGGCCVAGRSLDRIIKVAKASGYLKDFPPTIDVDEAMKLPKREVMIIATGGQGEARAALARIAFDSHPIKLSEGDTVVFSSKQIVDVEHMRMRTVSFCFKHTISCVTSEHTVYDLKRLEQEMQGRTFRFGG